MAAAAPPLAAALLAVLLALAAPAAAEIRSTAIRADPRTIIPLDEFGFSNQGVLELNVTGIAFDPPASPDLDLSQFGFFLSTLDAWVHVLRQLQDLEVTCALQSDLVRLAYSFDRLRPPANPAGVAVARSSSFTLAFRVTEPGQYTLVFANCLAGAGGDLKVSMDVSSAMYNVDPATGQRAYLSVGSSALPSIYFLFCVVYAALAAGWVSILLRKRTAVFRIHYFMLAVLVLKGFNLLAEAEDKSYIERTGTAHGWDVLFYIFSFLKGISLFTLIVLIGTGWSSPTLRRWSSMNLGRMPETGSPGGRYSCWWMWSAAAPFSSRLSGQSRTSGRLPAPTGKRR
ncbi:hypothetical protein VPH35_069442 [Triticum aestivum]